MDWIYIAYLTTGLLIIAAVIFGAVAQSSIASTYKKYSKVASKKGLTGYELAKRIASGELLDVSIKKIGGTLTDHYDPRDKSINLSASNFEGSSIAALGVVAHELGHAIQDKEGYKLFKIRQTVVKASGFVSKAFFPIVLVGFLFNLFAIGGIAGLIIMGCAIAFYAATLAVNLATLPVEIDASRRAMKSLKELMALDEEELAGAKKVLKAAAMTYVASLLMAFVYFLRFVLYAVINTRRD